MMLLGWTETNLWTLKYVQNPYKRLLFGLILNIVMRILRQRPPKSYIIISEQPICGKKSQKNPLKVFSVKNLLHRQKYIPLR